MFGTIGASGKNVSLHSLSVIRNLKFLSLPVGCHKSSLHRNPVKSSIAFASAENIVALSKILAENTSLLITAAVATSFLSFEQTL